MSVEHPALRFFAGLLGGMTQPPPNQPPVVSAGADQIVTAAASAANLSGTVTDDGLPNPPGAVTTSWSQVSGPGTATFGDASALATTVSFDAAGVYVLSLTADDGGTSANDSVQITVNVSPLVNAGVDQTAIWPANSLGLNGTVTDDGLPNPPGAVTTTWSKVSGPGNVVFANANALMTTAAFDAPGEYVLRLDADDGHASAFDTVAALVNVAPTVDAGADDLIEWPAESANLSGTVTDDGLPNPPGAVLTTWSKVSGPGNVTFGDASALATSASFDASGVYVLRLTADDGAAMRFDSVQIVANAAPSVDAGSAQLVIWPANLVTLSGTASDDGLPTPPGMLATLWSKIGGPGNVTFGDATALATSASFDAPGLYFLSLSASDGARVSVDDVQVTVNEPPAVDAGPDQVVAAAASTANLSGTVTDDGLPLPPGAVSMTWSKVSGPGTVTFGDASALSTTVTFGASGAYVLRLSADDGAVVSTDDIQITLNVSPVVAAGADQLVTWPTTLVSLNGSVTDDGLPNPPGSVTTAWSKASGPGNVTFTNAGALMTTATFDAPGEYVLRLDADDGHASAFDTLAAVVNDPPVVDAGADLVIDWPTNSVSLSGSVTDDGLPNPPGSITTSWSQVSGPGTVTFGDASAPATTATFDVSGTYVLRLTADDGNATRSDDVEVYVRYLFEILSGQDTRDLSVEQTPKTLFRGPTLQSFNAGAEVGEYRWTLRINNPEAVPAQLSLLVFVDLVADGPQVVNIAPGVADYELVFPIGISFPLAADMEVIFSSGDAFDSLVILGTTSTTEFLAQKEGVDPGPLVPYMTEFFNQCATNNKDIKVSFEKIFDTEASPGYDPSEGAAEWTFSARIENTLGAVDVLTMEYESDGVLAGPQSENIAPGTNDYVFSYPIFAPVIADQKVRFYVRGDDPSEPMRLLGAAIPWCLVMTKTVEAAVIFEGANGDNKNIKGNWQKLLEGDAVDDFDPVTENGFATFSVRVDNTTGIDQTLFLEYDSDGTLSGPQAHLILPGVNDYSLPMPLTLAVVNGDKIKLNYRSTAPDDDMQLRGGDVASVFKMSKTNKP